LNQNLRNAAAGQCDIFLGEMRAPVLEGLLNGAVRAYLL
jgi:hypothetical protein